MYQRLSARRLFLAGCVTRPVRGPPGLDPYCAERLILGPGQLALLVELKDSEQRHRHRHPIGADDGLVEAEATSPQELAQVGQALGERYLGCHHVAGVHRCRGNEQPAHCGTEQVRVVGGPGILKRSLPQPRRQRRGPEAVALL